MAEEAALPSNIGESGPHIMSATQSISSPDGDPGSHEEAITMQAEAPAAREELVTIPLMKLQQLVEFCAQVLRESRRKEPISPDIEIQGQADIVTSKLTTVAEAQGLDHVCKPEDFRPRNLLVEPHVLSKEALLKCNALWDEVRSFKEEFDAHFNCEAGRYHEHATTVLNSCNNVADLHRLFENPRFSSSPWIMASALAEIFVRPVRVARFLQDDTKLLVTICFLGAVTNSIGSILHGCYSSGALERPARLDHGTMLKHIEVIIMYACYFDRVHAFPNMGFSTAYLDPPRLLLEDRQVSSLISFTVDRSLELLFSDRSLRQILGLSVTRLYQLLSFVDADMSVRQVTDLAIGNTFRVDDMNVKALHSLGKLRIVWTLILENHLLLDLETMVLYIVWQLPGTSDGSLMGVWDLIAFDATKSEGFCGSSRVPNVSRTGMTALDHEVQKTWAILFATDKNEKNRQKYYKIVSDEELTSRYRIDSYEELKGYKELRRIHLFTPLSILQFSEQADFEPTWRLTRETLSYTQFPVFENRLRQLRFYMDSQKPRGFRQLWKDKRDTLNYCTFWGVIIFGSLSIFLAFFSLAVSIAQTVASFKALNAS